MNRKVVIAGIGTEIGKTISSAIIVKNLQADYWKPIQSGFPEDSDVRTVLDLSNSKDSNIHPSIYNLKAPLSPHSAAELEGREIRLENFNLPDTNNSLVVELAGGILVPLNKKETNLDLLKKWNLPVILVSKTYLGSINHTLLSFEILKSNNIPIMGLIVNGEKNESAQRFISNYTHLPIIFDINLESNWTPELIENYAKSVIWPA